MAAGRYNFTIEQGATFRRTFKYKNSEGVGIDLSLHDVTMQIRESAAAANFILDVNEAGATKHDNTSITSTKFTVSTVNNNEFSLVIDADTTASMSFDTAQYDIEVKDSLDEVTRLLQGNIKLSREVTK
tara:strand:+ start:35 stop:421 length:387 start_codon:yes stop_codon:yes gene_type:complete